MRPTAYLVALVALAPLGCFTSSSGGAADASTASDSGDAGMTPFDSGTIEPVDATTIHDGAAPMDATTDVAIDSPAPDAGATFLLLTTVTGSDSSFGATFTSGAWSALSPIGTDEYAAVGGGVAALPDGRGVVVLRGNSTSYVESTTWNGTWAPLTAIVSTANSFASAPVATATGAVAAQQLGTGEATISLDTFDDTTSTWMTAVSTGAVGDNSCIPVVALDAAGDPLVLFTATPGAATTYEWVSSTAGVWGATAAVPGMTLEESDQSPAVVATKRAGVDQIVAVFLTGGPTAFTLSSATYSAGAWSTVPTLVASDVFAEGDTLPMSIAPLADGRVALAYVTSGLAIDIGFFDGTSWSAFNAVPSVTSTGTYAPLSIARGVAGATLELAYIDANLALDHARLTGSTWSTPTVLDATQTYDLVSIAAGP